MDSITSGSVSSEVALVDQDQAARLISLAHLSSRMVSDNAAFAWQLRKFTANGAVDKQQLGNGKAITNYMTCQVGLRSESNELAHSKADQTRLPKKRRMSASLPPNSCPPLCT